MILAGDIGATKTNLGLFEQKGQELKPVLVRSFPSQSYSSLGPMIKEFLKDRSDELGAAVFGIAGPVIDGRSETSNLPWHVSADQLRKGLNIACVDLINDLGAMALGIGTLPESAFAVLNTGQEQPGGDRVVIAAGTGLGEAALVWDHNVYRVIPSEGGHADFAARNELEWELCLKLMLKFGRVSYERILSGPGILNIYNFLRERSEVPEPLWLQEEMAREDPSIAITEAALKMRDAVCREVLNLFISNYGAEAGNLALKFMATGGVFIGGGIAITILHKLQETTFMKAFTAKGRLAGLLSTIPVKVISDPLTPLYGAALAASLLVNNAMTSDPKSDFVRR